MEATPILCYKRTFGRLSHQLADGLTESQPVTCSVSFRRFQRIVFELKSRPRHRSTILQF